MSVRIFLGRSWHRYIVVKRLEGLLKNLESGKRKYELENIIERYLISVYPSITPSESHILKMREEMKEKRISLTHLKKIEKILRSEVSPPLPTWSFEVEVRPKKVYFTFGPYFAKSITREMYEILGGVDWKVDIFRCLIDYHSLLPRGQQWMIPLEDYKRYVSEMVEGGTIIEAFASPFNSQILRLMWSYEESFDGRFCSIGEHDGAFGSLGNFFNLKAVPGATIVVNPPFVEEILLRAAVRSIKLSKGDISKIVFYGPYWKDSKYYKLLSASGFSERRLKKYKHYYEGLEGEKIWATFESVVFTLKK